jgi:hypothetical protein
MAAARRIYAWIATADWRVRGTSMTVNMAAGKACLASLTITDAAGNPAPVAAPPTWVSSDPTGLAVNPQPDGMAALVASKAYKVGTYTVTVSADANLDPVAIRMISTTFDVVVSAINTAENIEVTAGVPY